MSSSSSSSSSHLFIYHRDLTVHDEEASPEERAERVLYYFPTNTPIPERARRVDLVESMRGFAELAGGGDLKGFASLNSRFVLVRVDATEPVWIVSETVINKEDASSASGEDRPVEGSPGLLRHGLSKIVGVARGKSWRSPSTSGSPGSFSEHTNSSSSNNHGAAPDAFPPSSLSGCPDEDRLRATRAQLLRIYQTVELLLGPIHTRAEEWRTDSVCAAVREAQRLNRGSARGLVRRDASMSLLLDKSPLEAYRRALRRVMPFLLTHSRLETPSIFSELDGLEYVPVDPATFLSVQAFASNAKFEMARFAKAKRYRLEVTPCLMVHRNNVLWSSFRSPESSRRLIKFIRIVETCGLGAMGDSGQGFLRLGVLLDTATGSGGHHGSKFLSPIVYLPRHELEGFSLMTSSGSDRGEDEDDEAALAPVRALAYRKSPGNTVLVCLLRTSEGEEVVSEALRELAGLCEASFEEETDQDGEEDGASSRGLSRLAARVDASRARTEEHARQAGTALSHAWFYANHANLVCKASDRLSSGSLPDLPLRGPGSAKPPLLAAALAAGPGPADLEKRVPAAVARAMGRLRGVALAESDDVEVSLCLPSSEGKAASNVWVSCLTSSLQRDVFKLAGAPATSTPAGQLLDEQADLDRLKSVAFDSSILL